MHMLDDLRNIFKAGQLFAFRRNHWLHRALFMFTSIVVSAMIAIELDADALEIPMVIYILRLTNWLFISGLITVLIVRFILRQSNILDFFVDERVNLFLSMLSFFIAIWEPRAAGSILLLRFIAAAGLGILAEFAGSQSALFKLLSPSKTLALSFLAMILLGALLLVFPAATKDGQGASFTDAVFTMASAISVTGLIVQDTGSYFSNFGYFVIFLAMQVGAIGIMVLAASFAVLVGGRLSGKQQEGLDEAGFGGVIDVSSVEGLKRLALSITLATFAIELIGALILYLMWFLGVLPLQETYNSWNGALIWTIFHSVSAFCHAGFSLEADSLMRFVEIPSVSIVFMFLILLGSFGFPVLIDMYPRRGEILQNNFLRRMWRRYHTQTKVVLVASLLLNVLGFLCFLYFEFNGALSGLSLRDKIIAAVFQSVTLRSAGLNTVSMSNLLAPTIIISLFLMFIGSAPASSGGGVRITTFAVVIMALRAMLLNRNDVEIFGRRLSKNTVYRSISIVLVAGLIVVFSLILITATQRLPFEKLIFETVSAFGTVGLSMGITEELDTFGRWVMSFLMYFGRVGPLTLALAIGERFQSQPYRYPEGRIAVG